MLSRMLLILIAVFCLSGCDDRQYEFDASPAVSSEVEHWDVGRKVLAFSVPGCGACERDKPKLAEIRRQGVPQGLGVVEIDATEYPELAEHLGVDKYPTYVVVEDGEVRGFTDTLKIVLKVLKIAFMIAIWLL